MRNYLQVTSIGRSRDVGILSNDGDKVTYDIIRPSMWDTHTAKVYRTADAQPFIKVEGKRVHLKRC